MERKQWLPYKEAVTIVTALQCEEETAEWCGEAIL